MNESFEQEMKCCKEALDLLKKCADSCRSFASKCESMFCKTTFLTVCCCLDGCCKAIEMCLDCCSKGGTEKSLSPPARQ